MAVVGTTRDFVTSYETFQRKIFARCIAMTGSLARLILLSNPGFLLASTPARIAGRVLDVRGDTVPHAHLSLRTPSKTLLSETFTSSEGTFQFSGVASPKTIEQAEQRAEDEKLEARIRLASLVIVGKVNTVRPLSRQGRVGPITEHDPDWQVAEIDVESVLKGTFSKSKISVLYPKSTDVMWFAAPRFRQEQEGVWLLQKAQVGKRAEDVTRELGIPAYTALNPLDFDSKSNRVRIQKLISQLAKNK